jgi:hypothetical protein
LTQPDSPTACLAEPTVTETRQVFIASSYSLTSLHYNNTEPQPCRKTDAIRVHLAASPCGFGSGVVKLILTGKFLDAVFLLQNCHSLKNSITPVRNSQQETSHRLHYLSAVILLRHRGDAWQTTASDREGPISVPGHSTEHCGGHSGSFTGFPVFDSRQPMLHYHLSITDTTYSQSGQSTASLKNTPVLLTDRTGLGQVRLHYVRLHSTRVVSQVVAVGLLSAVTRHAL